MRNLEAIEKDLAAAREALSSVEGSPAEVYSRIVGYYRSVRNWNKGKREEYGERRLFRVNAEHRSAYDGLRAAAPSPSFTAGKPAEAVRPQAAGRNPGRAEPRLLLFVRASCPGCPPAKTAAGRLGIPVDTVNADTADGMAEAVRRNVMSTPTAILLSPNGEEIKRAGSAETIGSLLSRDAPAAT
jgi:ribonucleoside-triphosphate reductase